MDLIPVDHDPFERPLPPSPLAAELSGLPERVGGAALTALGPIGEAGETVGDWLRTGHVDPRDVGPVLGSVMMGVAAPEETGVGTDLAMDAASRFGRAQRMGFRTGMPLYHGSGDAFSSFRAVPTTEPGTVTPGVSVALDPDVANEFAQGSGRANPQVYPLLHRAEKPAVLTLDGSESHAAVVGTLRDAFEAGHDAVMLKNYTTPGSKTGKNIIIVRSADQLRSPHAAFDPAKKFSPELLASIGGVMAVPAAGLAIPVDHSPFAQ